ncbi:MAG: radical SAM protein [bacterium]
MKFLLINPPIREWAQPNCFPSGLGYIAAAIARESPDWEVEVLDVNALRLSKEQVEEYIRNADYDLVGTSGLITIYKYNKWLIGILKKYHLDKKIIVGGSCATSVPHIMMEKNPVDILCIGEGEVTVTQLLHALSQGSPLGDVNGIWFRTDAGEIVHTPPRQPIMNLDELPHPKWELFPMDIYSTNPIGAVNVNKWVDGKQRSDLQRKSMNLTPTRGCVYQCTFCYHDFMGAKHRSRSPENVVEEILALKEKYNIEYFHFTDDCFVTSRKHVMRFCDLLLKENLNIEWGCAGRVNLMTEELIAKMREAGCILIGYGIESGSQKMLDSMKKRVSVEAAKNAVRLTQKYFGWADCSFVVGLPGETRETIQETIDFCKELNLVPEVIFFATPYPRTELYEIAMKTGKIPDEEEYILSLGEQGEKVRINFTDFSDEELTQIKLDMVRELDAWNKIVHE